MNSNKNLNEIKYKFINEKSINIERSFTPPFAKLKPIKLKISNIDDEYNENSNNVIFNQLRKTRALTNKDEQLLDLIYDHVLGCYYDPKTEIYYELKDK